MLLNRASPWLDIHSYLPCEGRIVLKNKTARRVSLLMPSWVNKAEVTCTVNAGAVEVVWPDGTRERFHAPGVDRQIVVTQGQGEASEG